jgi:dipeptidyl-peptidase-3
VEKFADIQILHYQVPGFEALPLQQKKLIFYLSKAALEGRDILFDQNGKYNLRIRRTLEVIYLFYDGDQADKDFQEMVIYLKRVWFSNGIYHHYGCEKFVPGFSPAFLQKAMESIDEVLFPLAEGQTVEELYRELYPVIFDPSFEPTRVNQKKGDDLLLTSACHYYENVSQSEAENFYHRMRKENDSTPISYGLNSRLVKKGSELLEEVWREDDLYTEAIEKIIYWLERAAGAAENEQQKHIINLLIRFYRTGDLKTFDEYSIAWLKETQANVDFINGFIETYGDPIGLKGSWEALVNYKDEKATLRTQIISSHAQWFEDNSPTDKAFKKEVVKGVSAKAITAAILGGDLYPSTAIGINLPNAEWIRALHGSKSVTISNITAAYHEDSRHNGFMDEFVCDKEMVALMTQYGELTDELHTDLHECLGHGSGKLLPGVSQDALGAYGATIEEARADLFGLYYMGDRMLVDLGLLPNTEAYKAEYYSYMMNGLMTQLVRIQRGHQIEEAHMRNRQLIAKWVYEKAKDNHIVELVRQNDKTYVRIDDYERLRTLFGELLAEIQRIKSTGDFSAAQMLVETYGVMVDEALHEEVLTRYGKLNLSPYKGFVNPRYIPVTDKEGHITDVQIDYSETYVEQMLRYSREYSSLPSIN